MNIRDPRTQKILLGAVALGGLFYVYFGLSILPFGYPAKAAEIKQLKADYAKVSSEVTQAQRLAADLPRVQALHERTTRKWERANELLPTNTDMAGLLRAITLAGFTSGIEFVKFEPQNSANFEYYAENPVEITVVGGYHEVGSFFSELSSLSRLVTVRVLRMYTLSGGDEGETVTATFNASAYSVNGSHVRPTGSSVSAPQKVTPKRGPMKSAPRIEE